MTRARSDGYDRPWAPRSPTEAPPAADAQTSSAPKPAGKRDATPRAEDLAPGD